MKIKLRVYRKEAKKRERKETLIVKKINPKKSPVEMKGSLFKENRTDSKN